MAIYTAKVLLQLVTEYNKNNPMDYPIIVRDSGIRKNIDSIADGYGRLKKNTNTMGQCGNVFNS